MGELETADIGAIEAAGDIRTQKPAGAPEEADVVPAATGAAPSLAHAAGTPGLGGSVAALSDDEVSVEVYLGVVKSYNDRRGFGFLACAETAARFGRDVYMPKTEATAAAAQAAAEAAVEAAAMTGDEAALPSAEFGEDLCSSIASATPATGSAGKEAEKVKDSGKDPGKDTAKERDKGQDTDKDKENDKDKDKDIEKSEKPATAPRLAEEDLVQFHVKLSIEGYPQAARVKRLRKFSGLVVRVPCEEKASEGGAGAIVSDEATRVLGIPEVPLRGEACGQVRLAVGDEVTFCVPTPPDAPKDGAKSADLLMQAEARLVFLSRTSRSNRSVLGCFTLDLPRTGAAEEVPERPNLLLDCHAFGDKLILAGLPEDLEEVELMRFFSKQGATGAIVAKARSCSFASVSFPGMMEVARFIGRTAHAFADDKETRIAKLLSLTPSEDTARLPALPSPTVSTAEEPGSLLVVWSPLVLAVAYTVELRPSGGAWATVDVAPNQPGSSGNRFDSDCSSCKVTGLQISTAYEARVSYFTECGTKSEASEPSEPCLTTAGPSAVATAPAVGSGLGAAEGFGTTASAPPGYPAMGDINGGFAAPPGQTPISTMPPGPPTWHPWVGADGFSQGVVGPTPQLLHDAYGPLALPTYGVSPGWRSASGLVVPPPAAPELRAVDEHGFAVSIQWPAVLQAVAYVVELREAGSTAAERFVRSAPDQEQGALVELRVGGLRPGSSPGRIYVAQVRTVGADGSESAPSPPGWSPPLGGHSLAFGAAPAVSAPPPASAPTMSAAVLSADAAPWQPPMYLGPEAAVRPSTLPQVAPDACAAVSSACPPPPLAPPLVAPPAPPAPPPPQPPPAVLGGWAPPPWLGQAEPAGATLGSLGDQAPPLPGAPGAPHYALTAGPALPNEVSSVPWGAPGAPPPPPVGPPPMVPAGQAEKVVEAVEAPGGEEKCLILD